MIKMNGFEKWFSKATQRFEKALLKLGVLMLLLLFLAQFLLTNDTIRSIINPIERLEGEPIEQVFLPEYTDIQESIRIELELEGQAQALVKVLVNKTEVTAFTEQRVVLEVHEGDMIEIDGQEVEDAVTIRIMAVHGPLKTPLVGHSVTTFGTNELLGWVTLP
jgi:hypothetical protein